MMLGDLTSWIEALETRAGEFANRTEAAIVSSLVRFRDARGVLNYQLRKLTENPPQSTAPAQLKTEYQSALVLAQDAKDKADWLGKLADQFTALTGLGALPAIIAGVPVAVLLAGIAAITITISSVTTAVTRYLRARQLVATALAEGKDATGALSRYYASDRNAGIFGDAAQLVWPLAIAGGAYLLLSRRK